MPGDGMHGHIGWRSDEALPWTVGRLQMLVSAMAVVIGTAMPAWATGVMDIPGNFSTTAVLPFTSAYTSNRFESGDDADWYRVQLKRGDAVAFNFVCSAACDAMLVDPNGGSVAFGAGFGTYNDGGAGYVVPLDGTYFWTLTNRSGAPGTYRTRVARDCAAGAPTKCTLEPGQARLGDFFFDGDRDSWSVKLSTSRRYDVTLTTLGPEVRQLVVALTTQWGGFLQGQSNGPDGGPSVTLKGFRPPANGMFLVRVGPGPAGQYRLKVQPR